MEEYEVDAPVGEIVRWIREDAERDRPRLSVRAAKEYSGESVFDHAQFGIGEDEDIDLVSVHGRLEIQSRRGSRDWTLQLRLDEAVGLHPRTEEIAYESEDDMALGAFEEQFLSEGLEEVEVVVLAEKPAAKARFDRWLARSALPRTKRKGGPNA
jgi:hypothetical protein